MTLDTLFLLVVPTYLVLVAYGQVGSRRRGLGGRTRAVVGGLRVALPPLAIAAALAAEGAPVLRTWWLVTAAMGIAGAVAAVLAEVVAPRVGA